jgi:hypothetical protein
MRVLSPRSASLALPARTRPDGVPSIRWPSQRHLAPRRCGNCNAALLRTVVPTAEEPMVDVECLYCSRVVVELRHDAAPAPMTPARFAALPTQQGKRGKP